LGRPQIHLVVKPDPRGPNASHIALNVNIVNHQESHDLDESATCISEMNVEGAWEETNDIRTTVHHHHILMIVIHISKGHHSEDIQTRLGKPIGPKTGILMPTILPVATGGRYHRLIDQDHGEELGDRGTRILGQTQKTIIM
jgi:hypothetical protein